MPSAPTSVVIRPATKADREVVINLLLVQLHEHGIAIQAPDLAMPIDGVLTCPKRGILFVATLQRVPVGLAYLSFTWTLEHGGKTAWLEELYVVPEQRQKGIGQALLTAVCAHATEQDCAAVDLEVAPAIAVSTYVRLPCRIINPRPQPRVQSSSSQCTRCLSRSVLPLRTCAPSAQPSRHCSAAKRARSFTVDDIPPRGSGPSNR
jgi:GNAT superfamily N-acetyltransferase